MTHIWGKRRSSPLLGNQPFVFRQKPISGTSRGLCLSGVMMQTRPEISLPTASCAAQIRFFFPILWLEFCSADVRREGATLTHRRDVTGDPLIGAAR